MYINPDVIAGVLPLYPQGTNSTLFTECCEVAICDDEVCCPKCGRKILGYDCSNIGKARWEYATKYWRKKKAL